MAIFSSCHLPHSPVNNNTNYHIEDDRAIFSSCHLPHSPVNNTNNTNNHIEDNMAIFSSCHLPHSPLNNTNNTNNHIEDDMAIFSSLMGVSTFYILSLLFPYDSSDLISALLAPLFLLSLQLFVRL